MNNILDRVMFLATALRGQHIGALTWSSAALVENVKRRILPDRSLIIEYGPGMGAMTRELLPRLRHDGKLIAVEANEEFSKTIAAIGDPRVEVISGMAQHAAEELALRFPAHADLIISSIPLSLITPSDRAKIMEGSLRTLSPEGTMIIFHQYRLVSYFLLKKYFATVTVSVELRNIFPCFIFCATGKR